MRRLRWFVVLYSSLLVAAMPAHATDSVDDPPVSSDDPAITELPPLPGEGREDPRDPTHGRT